MSSKTPKTKALRMTARVYDKRGSSILVTVPVQVTTVPEVPHVIYFGNLDEDGWVAVLSSTNPLTYTSVLFAKGRKHGTTGTNNR